MPTGVSLVIFQMWHKTHRYVVNLQDVRKRYMELKDGVAKIKHELSTHFADVSNLTADDRFVKKMYRFVGESADRLDDLTDALTIADGSFSDVVRYYGEEDRNMTSSEFYGIFQIFVTSYRVGLYCWVCDATATEFCTRKRSVPTRRSPRSLPQWRNASRPKRT